ncbi:Geminivirus Rep-interacting motor protein [Platanthera guangdongensis]|uniref:Geminivirus Rep-interacting motor protein n=1 Tax=Platanthera guangdongensis TaxID=2320717 RepID=A0ABR2MWG4_9ASPA
MAGFKTVGTRIVRRLGKQRWWRNRVGRGEARSSGKAQQVRLHEVVALGQPLGGGDGIGVYSIPEYMDIAEETKSPQPFTGSISTAESEVTQWNVLQFNTGSMSPFIIKCGSNSASDLVIKADSRVQEPKGSEIVRILPRPSVFSSMSYDEIKRTFEQLPEAVNLLALAGGSSIPEYMDIAEETKSPQPFTGSISTAESEVTQWNVLQFNTGSTSPFIIKCGSNSASDLVIKADSRVQEPKGSEIVRILPRPSVLSSMSYDEIKRTFEQLPEAVNLLALARTADGTRARYSRLFRTLAMKVPSLRELVAEMEKGGLLKDVKS